VILMGTTVADRPPRGDSAAPRKTFATQSAISAVLTFGILPILPKL
jgi:hypothetical protein